MKHKALAFIALLALVSMLIIPVSAETLNGTLGGYGYNQTLFDMPYQTPGSTIGQLVTNDIESSGSMYTLVLWPGVTLPTDAGAPDRVSTSFKAYALAAGSPYPRVDDYTVATGTIGYQKIYNAASPPVEQTTGYIWIVFDEWNTTGRSGDLRLELNYTRNDLYNVTLTDHGNPSNTPSGGVCIGGLISASACIVGSYSNIKVYDAWASYSAIKPSGLGIAGTVVKTGNSRIFVTNISDYTIASENLANENTFSFSVLADQIYIKLLSPDNTWYNSSLLFSTGPPPPTVTPTPVPTIPPGYIVTYVRTFDPLTNSDIYGTDISMYDVEAAVWTNYTADPDGRGEIYTLPYHTLNLYATYPTEGVYNDAELLGVETGYGGGKLFYLDMYPYTPAPAEGYVELYTTVRNRDDKSPVTYASIGTTIISTGAYFGSSSGATGTDIYTYPNDTALRIIVNKAGYLTATVYTDTGDAEKKYVIIEMDRATVTPTPTGTVLPGETTVRPTIDPRTDSEKDADMMNQVRDAGPMLIGLAIIATIVGLMKLMAKK